MANPRVKHASLFYGASGKRVATLQGCKIKIKNGSGQEIADGGPYITDGPVTSEISADNIVPVTGMGVPMIQDLIDQKTLNMSIGLIDGKIMIFDDVRPVDVEISSEVASGKQMAAFNWLAGKPKLK